MTSFRDELRALPVLTASPRPFDVDAAPPTPHELFVDWFRQAVDAGEPEPHAMTLATSDAAGLPDARVLILKDLDEQGWWFATSAASPTGRQLSDRPTAALTFHWPSLGRQVRVRGPVVTAPDGRASTDFRERGHEARAIALTGRQNEPLGDPAQLEDALRRTRATLEADPAAVAQDWTLYAVTPSAVEFWQADPSRRHTRLRYTPGGSGWARSLLWP